MACATISNPASRSKSIRTIRAFQPRIGFAFSPDSKTVIRAGFGLFDDRYNLSFLFITQPQRPNTIPGEMLPGIRQGADTATWVLNQLTPGPPDPGGQVIFPANAAATSGHQRVSPAAIPQRPRRTKASRLAPAWSTTPAKFLIPSRPTLKSIATSATDSPSAPAISSSRRTSWFARRT